VFSYTAKGSGYFRVLVDAAVVTSHTTEREALENANLAKLAKPSAAVHVVHDYDVEVALAKGAQINDAVVGVPVSVTVMADDPTSVNVTGSLIVTPVKDADVTLRLAFLPKS
jgi:hypothetical protein